jgi:hypothetical protein
MKLNSSRGPIGSNINLASSSNERIAGIDGSMRPRPMDEAWRPASTHETFAYSSAPGWIGRRNTLKSLGRSLGFPSVGLASTANYAETAPPATPHSA